MTKFVGVLGPLVVVMFAGDVSAKTVYQTDGVAIRGYDPVAYFIERKPVMGTSEFRTEWGGAVWFFGSPENRDAFVAKPESYAPQFGGWCAYAAAHGRKARTVPEAWSIVDGKLYLNYSLDIQKKWNADRDNFIKRGHANWPTLKTK